MALRQEHRLRPEERPVLRAELGVHRQGQDVFGQLVAAYVLDGNQGQQVPMHLRRNTDAGQRRAQCGAIGSYDRNPERTDTGRQAAKDRREGPARRGDTFPQKVVTAARIGDTRKRDVTQSVARQ